MTLIHDNGSGTERSRAWRWRPFIGFEDTNLVGNVYFTHYVSWQGRCREAFLAEYAPDVLAELSGDLRLVTLSVSCEYYDELGPFDPVALEMRLQRRDGNRLTLGFDYWLERGDSPQLVARGLQQVACMRSSSDGLVPTSLPRSLENALSDFAGAPQ